MEAGAGGAGAGLVGGGVGRFLPRLRPEPRVEPNEPNGWVSPPALDAGAVTAGAAGAELSAAGAAEVPDVSGSVIMLFLCFLGAHRNYESCPGW